MYLFIQAFQNVSAGLGYSSTSLTDFLTWYNKQRATLTVVQQNNMDTFEAAKFLVFNSEENGTAAARALGILSELDHNQQTSTISFASVPITATGSNLPSKQLLQKRIDLLDKVSLVNSQVKPVVNTLAVKHGLR